MKLTLTGKLGLFTLVTISMVIAYSLCAHLYMRSLEERVHVIVDESVPLVIVVEEMNTHKTAVRTELKNYQLENDPNKLPALEERIGVLSLAHDQCEIEIGKAIENLTHEPLKTAMHTIWARAVATVMPDFDRQAKDAMTAHKNYLHLHTLRNAKMEQHEELGVHLFELLVNLQSRYSGPAVSDVLSLERTHLKMMKADEEYVTTGQMATSQERLEFKNRFIEYSDEFNRLFKALQDSGNAVGNDTLVNDIAAAYTEFVSSTVGEEQLFSLFEKEMAAYARTLEHITNADALGRQDSKMAEELTMLASNHLSDMHCKTTCQMRWISMAFVVVSVGAILGCWIFMNVLSRRIVKPILAMSEAVKAMAKGDLGKKVNVSAGDEIGDLCAAFNEMAEDLQTTTTSIKNLDREIAERRLAEEALRNETRLSRLLLDSMPCMALLVRPYSREVVASNKAAAEAGAVPGKSCYNACFGRGEPCSWCLAPQVWADGQDRHAQIEHQGICWDAHWLAISDDLYLHYAFDVTDQKHAEQERENLAKFPKENPNPVLRISHDGVVMFANPSSRVVLQTWGIQQGQKVPDDLRERIQNAVVSGKPHSFELICQNGRIFTVTLMPITQAGYVNAYGLDITERRKAEDALDQLNRDLESANRELMRTNKELQEFARIAAHDLKTPLRAIGTLADWIATDYADKFDEQGKEQVRLLVTKAKQMTALIDDILHYSGVGHSTQKPQPVDLNVLLAEMISELAPPGHIEIAVQKDLPTIVGKKTHLIQIFQNLLGNAIKYMDKPRGYIKVACVEQEDFWMFSVADNGSGIEGRYFEKIFEIFQTLGRRDPESTGIGLSIVKKLVELNNGRVWVESEIGQGSTFFFMLPKQKQNTITENACFSSGGYAGQPEQAAWIPFL